MALERSERAVAQRKSLEQDRRDRARRLRLNEQDHYERTWLDQPNSIHPELRLCKPTPETAKKAELDPIERLYEIGRRSNGSRGLIGEQRDAAYEIRAVYQAVAGALLSRSAWPDGRTPGRSGGIAEWLAEAYEGRYKPWARELSRRLVLTGSPMGENCDDVDCAFRWRHGRAADLLGEALTLYAQRMERPSRRRYKIR